mmetsp:Transcript_33943/g.45874  ORF Transcript_33943/g.45874 Transcript_33943/m.45874 type:complete len:178 (-) Transcript_33943:481-1014(-)
MSEYQSQKSSPGPSWLEADNHPGSSLQWEAHAFEIESMYSPLGMTVQPDTSMACPNHAVVVSGFTTHLCFDAGIRVGDRIHALNGSCIEGVIFRNALSVFGQPRNMKVILEIRRHKRAGIHPTSSMQRTTSLSDTNRKINISTPYQRSAPPLMMPHDDNQEASVEFCEKDGVLLELS